MITPEKRAELQMLIATEQESRAGDTWTVSVGRAMNARRDIVKHAPALLDAIDALEAEVAQMKAGIARFEAIRSGIAKASDAHK